MAFAPDGRLFVTQQTGALRIIQNGTLLATPFVTLSVNSSGERGLLGIAFDPNFTTNQYIYLYYMALLLVTIPYTTGTAQKMRVWEYGLRNPYTLSIQPVQFHLLSLGFTAI